MNTLDHYLQRKDLKMSKKGTLRFNKGGSKKQRSSNDKDKRKLKVNKKANARYEKKFVPAEDEDFNMEEFIVVGKNPVLEALRSDLQVERILILKDNTDHVLKDIADCAKNDKLVVQTVEKQKLESLAKGRPHQGVAALLAPFPYSDLDEVIEKVKDKENATFVICDHITDPHNFGAIIRNAEVCGADAVIFPQRRSAGLSPAAVKASSGAAAYIPLVKVNNLSQVIDKLKDNGFWIAAAEMKGDPYYNCNLKGKLGLILGAEGPGLSPKLEKMSDFLVSIPDYGKVDSLNVSAAAAVILSEAAKQQHQQ